MRGFSAAGTASCPGALRSRLAPVRSRSSRGGRPIRREDERWWEEEPATEPLLVDRSSGGGVGGKTFRLRGGSDC
jgi:hypothetical protein